MELDHLIVFLAGPEDVDAARIDAAGLVLDGGTRHVGQGTRNRRIVFPDSYVELLWVDSPVEARASGLRFVDRCSGAACPFGVVARGRLPEHPGFVGYAVPGGPVLHVIDEPRTPFLAVHESDDLDRLRPARRMAPEYVNRSTAITHVEIACAAPPELGVPGVSFVRGDPELRLTLTGRRTPLIFRRSRPSRTTLW